MNIQKSDSTVSRIILQQLGGMGKLSAMINAKNFVYDSNSITFHFSSCRKANIIKIELNSFDLYDITFYKYNKRSLECNPVKEYNDIYAEDMKELIEDFTGLYLSL